MSKRRILVTGAASGIGAALMRVLREQNATPIGIDRTATPDITVCDLTSEQSARECAAEIGAVSGIAYVAGLPGTHLTADIVRVNFLAIRQLTDLLLREMSQSEPQVSAIVSVSSVTAHRCEMPELDLAVLADAHDSDVQQAAAAMDGTQAYAFSKKLLNVWTQMLAARLIGRGIRANAIAPGPVETPILEDFRTSMGADRIAAAENVTGRHGTADEIAAAAAFLLSPAASWINGAIIPCDGGFSAARFAQKFETGESA